MFDSVLIANRGEIARRVMRTCRRLGVRTIAVHTDADRGMPHVREGDDAVHVASYLDIDAIVAAARRSGAQAIHPGYGFLSERPNFVRACEDAGLVFIGPSAAAMEALGDKVSAKAVAARAGVPTVPGYSEQEARAATGDYPLLVKAAAGGGGRGMRVVGAPGELDEALAAARREAAAGFGDDRVFIERFLPRARHIEVQLIADAHGTALALGERECSLQRRHQKVVEEAPSPVVDAALREQLGREAVALAQATGYVGAGTVEYIADADDPSTHYFLEVNARLQVEHPVTELVTGLDLVELQLLVASGAPLPLTQEEVVLRGHAIEVRLNAEDAAAGFLPSAGPVLAYRRPAGVRVDDAIEAGVTVGTSYDSMLGKLIAHGADREAALHRLDRALADTAILGLTTNTGYLRRLLATREVRTAEMDTGLLGRLELPPPTVDAAEVAAAAALIETARAGERAVDDPFARTDGWRIGGQRAWSHWRLAVDGSEPTEIAVRLQGPSDLAGLIADVKGLTDIARVEVERVRPDAFAITARGERRTWTYAHAGTTLWLAREGDAFRVRRPTYEEVQAGPGHGSLRAPMPGQVLLVAAAAGDRVREGDAVVILESMKMELTIAAPFDGTVTEIGVAAGDRVGLEQPLATVEPDAA